MSRPATIDSLLGFQAKDDCNILAIKDRGDFSEKNQNILRKLVLIGTFEEVSEWVSTHSEGQKYIANPSSASDTDRLDCLFEIQGPLVLALKNVEKRRKNGRDTHLLDAVEARNYSAIANILASTAWTYWLNHGFHLEHKSRLNAAFQLKNEEKDLEKREFYKAQIERIGAVVSFEKAQKKGSFQEVFDFEETMLVIGKVE